MGNDVIILMVILVFLVALGIISPLIQAGTNTQVHQQDYDFDITNYTTAYANLPTPVSWTTSGWHIIFSIFTAIFWVFSWMPPWIILFHVILRFILVVVAYRLVRSGAG